MTTIAEIANKGACGAGSVLGTNSKKGCLQQLSSVRSIWLFSPGSSFATGSTFNLAAVKTLQKQGKLIVLQGVNTFEENGDDDAIETLDDTTKIVTNEGKYSFDMTFTNGRYFNKALHTLKGFGNWNAAFVDSKGTILGAINTSSGLTGFDTGMMQPKKLQFGTTSAGQKEGLMLQFLDRNEVDSGYMMIEKANLDFDPLKVEGVSEVILSYTSTPSNTDTTISVKATLADNKTAVEGLLHTQFLRKSDSATENPSAGSDSVTAGTYVLTVAAISTGEVETIELYDNSNNRGIIEDTNGDLYQSAEITATAVA